MTFRFIAENADAWPVAGMCEAREVSVSGYYAWTSRPDRSTDRWRPEWVAPIEGVHDEVKPRYGSPRGTAELKARGHACPENTVAELMRARGIRAHVPRRFIRTTDSNHRRPVAENVLDRDFDPEGRTSRGAPTARMSRPARAGCIWLSSRIYSAA